MWTAFTLGLLLLSDLGIFLIGSALGRKAERQRWLLSALWGRQIKLGGARFEVLRLADDELPDADWLFRKEPRADDEGEDVCTHCDPPGGCGATLRDTRPEGRLLEIKRTK